MNRTVAGLLLAAGGGRRYGMPKALAVQDGRLLVERGLATLREGGCDPVVVVLGAAADEVRAGADLEGATVVTNHDWPTGLGSSLRAGLAALQLRPVDAVAVLLVDTPGITPEVVARMLSHDGVHALAAATYHGEPGHPVVFGRTHWAGVAALAVGDVGARPYLDAHHAALTAVPCEDLADGTDIDEPGSGW